MILDYLQQRSDQRGEIPFLSQEKARAFRADMEKTDNDQLWTPSS